MIIQKISSNNMSFTAKLTIEAKNQMSEILLPLVKNCTPIREIIKQTGYTADQINRWSYRRYGVTVTQLYETKEKEKLKKEFIEHQNNRTKLKDMVKIYGHSYNWVKQRVNEFGVNITSNLSERKKLMEEKVPKMLDAGYTLNMMQDELNISIETIQSWIWKKYGCTIREYRRIHNIHCKQK